MTLGTPVSNRTDASRTSETGSPRPQETVTRRRPRDRHTRRIVFGLASMLGIAWALVIASRYPDILPGLLPG